MFWTTLTAFFLFAAIPKQGQPTAPLNRRRRPAGPAAGFWRGFLGQPRNAVFIALIAAFAIGGGRRLRRAIQGRDARNRLDDPDIQPLEIEKVAQYGRAGLIDLFQILENGKTPEQRQAAGRALAILWADDEMIPEEEKAVLIRGHQVTWRARRRYPRGLRSEIPFGVVVDVPFMKNNPKGVDPKHLEWSFRVSGSRRASLEAFGPWMVGAGEVHFAVIPQDFETNGPHQVSIQTRVRTMGLTDNWEITLPHSRFLFEFDPLLDVNALLTLPDEARGVAFQEGLKLVTPTPQDGKEAPMLPLGQDFAMANPPSLQLPSPLPCDLSHKLQLEFEGIEKSFAAGFAIISKTEPFADDSDSRAKIAIGPRIELDSGSIDRPGRHKIRLRLIPEPDLGWTNPEIRSIWPGMLVTDWEVVDILRR